MTWDELLKDGETALAGLVGTQESLTLEFKSSHERNPLFNKGLLTEHGRRVLAKEMSAFANSAGGLIILGVNCREHDRIDQVQSLEPLESIAVIETSVRGAVSELLQPVHDGIEVHAIRSAKNQAMGYLVISVPRSDRRPHRSEAKDQKQYFKRTGTSAVVMEHYDVEDAFSRRSAPRLSIRTAFRPRFSDGTGKVDMLLQIALYNDSEDASAKAVTLQIWNRSGLAFAGNHQRLGISKSDFGGRTILAAPSEYVVHPEQTRSFDDLHFQVVRAANGVLSEGAGFTLIPGMLGFNYSIGAEGMRAVNGRYELDEGGLEELRHLTGRK